MKLLLDECVPERLAASFPDTCEVATVRRMGWGGTKNGALLEQAAGYGFDALVTTDARMGREQDPDDLPVNVVLLRARRNRLADLQPLVPKILPALSGASGSAFVKVQAARRHERNEQAPA